MDRRELPILASGQAVVRVEAAGVSFAEVGGGESGKVGLVPERDTKMENEPRAGRRAP